MAAHVAWLVLVVALLVGVAPNVRAEDVSGPKDGATLETLKVAGGELCFEARGSGPVVVFLHAGLLDGRMWGEQVDRLADDYRVIRYDARGHGCPSVPVAYQYKEFL
jgi:pimeloyl-ACP methyl ester carboxylesterase